jgi:hypothetical protein
VWTDITLILLSLMMLRFLYAVFVGARDGIHRQQIQRGGHGPELVGRQAVAYCWFCVLGGTLLAMLCALGFALVLRS